jgi:ribosomal-protein-alanine N-acetyltransferase
MSISDVTTSRLVLRPMRAPDWVSLRLIDDDPAVMATLGGLRSEKETMAYAFAQEDHWERHGFGWWMAFLRDTGAFVGRGGLRRLEIGGVLEIEVGYALLRPFWDRGFATEIAEAAVRVGTEDLRLGRLVGITLKENDASRRVLEKVGFRYERELTWASLPHVLYALESGPPSMGDSTAPGPW